mmetsp:Transcript_34722/g.87297  ORF Transcript_34722/g.87297 Transcript_34722/m.87297 type:complete len:384 (-) Transcript_34722:149-1300(-)
MTRDELPRRRAERTPRRVPAGHYQHADVRTRPRVPPRNRTASRWASSSQRVGQVCWGHSAHPHQKRWCSCSRTTAECTRRDAHDRHWRRCSAGRRDALPAPWLWTARPCRRACSGRCRRAALRPDQARTIRRRTLPNAYWPTPGRRRTPPQRTVRPPASGARSPLRCSEAPPAGRCAVQSTRAHARRTTVRCRSGSPPGVCGQCARCSPQRPQSRAAPPDDTRAPRGCPPGPGDSTCGDSGGIRRCASTRRPRFGAGRRRMGAYWPARPASQSAAHRRRAPRQPMQPRPRCRVRPCRTPGEWRARSRRRAAAQSSGAGHARAQPPSQTSARCSDAGPSAPRPVPSGRRGIRVAPADRIASLLDAAPACTTVRQSPLAPRTPTP